MITGSKVICVDDSFPEWVLVMYRELPVKDRVYTVRSVGPGRGIPGVIRIVGDKAGIVENGGGDRQPEIQVLLEEIHNGQDPLCAGRELGFRAERFAMVDVEEAIERCRQAEEAAA